VILFKKEYWFLFGPLIPTPCPL